MANLSIKDVPERLAEALRLRASRNHRSLQGELMAIIEQAANESEAARDRQPVGPLGLHAAGGVKRGGTNPREGKKSIEQIYAEHLERFPQPFTEGRMSVDIIRHDRDSR